MTKIIKYIPHIAIAIAVLMLVLGVRGCIKDRQIPSFDTPLTQDVLSQTLIQDRHIVVRTQKETKAAYVPDDGSAVASVDKEGHITLDVKSFGLSFRPELGMLVTDRLRGALGAQLGYWDRFEIHAGVAMPKFVAYGCLAYRLDQLKLRNTSIGVVYTTDKALGVAVLLKF